MGHVLKLDAVLFDLDGTLVDSVPDVRWALNQALAAEGRAEVSIEKVKDYVGHGAHQLAERALRDTGGMVDDVQHKRLLDGFLDTYRNNPVQFTTVFPGVFEALRRLQARNIKLAICTNKPDITTWPVLRTLGFDKIFPVVLCGDKARKQKPDGAHVIETAEMLGVDPANCIMIGDSENDILAAHDAGVPSVCVTFGYCHVPLEELKPSVVIDHFDALDGAIEQIVNGSGRA